MHPRGFDAPQIAGRTTMRTGFALTLALLAVLMLSATPADAQSATATAVATPAATPAAEPAPDGSGGDSSTTTSTEVASPTSTSTEVRSPTNTSTEAYTADNFTVTVTGGAGSGDTTVNIYPPGAAVVSPTDPAAAAGQPTAQMIASCKYKLGFAALAILIPAIVGGCVTDETHNQANGDGWQESEGGLMVWRKADNWTAFTDGYRTWINGPAGLQVRLNTLRYSWEANPTNLPAA